MKYILDFDGVIFNTKDFKVWLNENGFEGALRNEAMIEALEAKIETGELDMKSFVFPDAETFIEAHPDSEVLSSARSRIDENNEADEEESLAFQRFKIKASGVTQKVSRVEVVYDEKVELLKQMTSELSGRKAVFVDDTKKHLDDAEGLHENLSVVHMMREPKQSFEGIVERGMVSSFKSLEGLTKSWEQKEK